MACLPIQSDGCGIFTWWQVSQYVLVSWHCEQTLRPSALTVAPCWAIQVAACGISTPLWHLEQAFLPVWQAEQVERMPIEP